MQARDVYEAIVTGYLSVATFAAVVTKTVASVSLIPLGAWATETVSPQRCPGRRDTANRYGDLVACSRRKQVASPDGHGRRRH